ncbi:MAG: hypothetical protein CK425_06115 [Parachlamydia sp.]|nr:MAG: hypothetical protein CK425_06115 [Parachlamydia sp.]
MKKIFCTLMLFSLCLSAEDLTLISKEIYTFNRDDLNKLKNSFGIHSFIETGTAGGETTELAAKLFPEVHSIEIYENNHLIAKKRLSRYPNVYLYLGDTSLMLKDLINHSHSKRLYWLDAHCSGEGTGGIPGFSPIENELNIIKAYGSEEDVILIDDLRGMYYADARTALPLRLIAKQVKQINPHYEFYTIGDIACIFNRKLHPHITVSNLVQACTKSYLFDPDNNDQEYLQDIITRELFGIAAARPDSEEAKNILKFYRRYYVHLGNGGDVIYLLWKALFELGNHYHYQAIASFKELLETPLAHWRISAYLTRALVLAGQPEEARTLFQKSLRDVYQEYPQLIKSILTEEWLSYLQ